MRSCCNKHKLQKRYFYGSSEERLFFGGWWRSCWLKKNLLPVISIFMSIIKPEEKCVISQLCFWISGIPCMYIIKHRWDIENNSLCQNSDSKDALMLYMKRNSLDWEKHLDPLSQCLIFSILAPGFHTPIVHWPSQSGHLD